MRSRRRRKRDAWDADDPATREANQAGWDEIERVGEEIKHWVLGAHCKCEECRACLVHAQFSIRLPNDSVPRIERAMAAMSPVPFDVVRVCEEMKRHALGLLRQ
jgi:hypothetical protein